MSLNISSLAAFNITESELRDEEWRKILDVADYSNPLVTFPRASSCEIPVAELLNITRLQLRLRCALQSQFLLKGASYIEYLCGIQKKGHWDQFEVPPKPAKIINGGANLHYMLLEGMGHMNLPSSTRAWFRAAYKAMLEHAHRVVDCAAACDPRTVYFEYSRKEPKGDISALYGPYGIYLRCAELKDYESLYLSKCGENVTDDDLKNARTSHGFFSARNIPADAAKNVVLCAENCAVQNPSCALATHKHETDHSIQSFFEHSSTLEHPACRGDPSLMRYVRSRIDLNLKKELIAWSLETDEFQGLFLGANPPYDFVKYEKNRLERENIPAGVVDSFSKAAAKYLNNVVKASENALNALMKIFPRGDVREMLRTQPLSEWPRIAAQLTGEAADL